MPPISHDNPAARVLVETDEGMLYHRSPSAPPGRVLLIHRGTLEPLLVDFGDGWELPLRETFDMMIGDGTLRLRFDEHAFDRAQELRRIEKDMFDMSVPVDHRSTT